MDKPQYSPSTHLKYGSRVQAEGGGYFHFPAYPGYHGLPMRMAQNAHPPLVRKDELKHAPVVGTFDFRLFDLNDPAQRSEFQAVNDAINTGWYFEKKRMERWPDDKEYPQIYLEWLVLEVRPRIDDGRR